MSGLFGEGALVEQAKPEPAAYRVLARKYRPTGFDDLIGQEAMVRTLRNAFTSGRIAHAFMLTGVRGVGKTTTARIIARALNCTGPDGLGGPTATPCGVCADCRAILADRHPDVVEMDAASRTGVDDVREIIEGARFRPMQARTKVFVVDEVHMLSRNAFNALLKTLEEPPGHVKFIFATTEWRKVPVTVLSRCQRFDLKRVPLTELSTRFARITELEGARASPEAMDLIAQAADGSVRDGLSLLDQAIALGASGVSGDEDDSEVSAALVTDMLGLGDRSVVYDVMEALVAGQVGTVLAITERMHEHGADLSATLCDLLEIIHLLTRLRSMPNLQVSKDLPELERTRGSLLAAQLSIPVLTRIWQTLLKGVSETEAAPDRRAAAEMVLIRLCYLSEMPAPGELVAQMRRSPTSSVTEMTASRRDLVPVPQLVHSSALAFQPDPLTTTKALPAGLRDIVTLAHAANEPLLVGYLQHSVHLVRFAPPIIELRPEPETPRDFTTRLAALLLAKTGSRWTIAVSTAPGDLTLGAQDEAQALARRSEAEQHPLVRAVLASFPGAVLRGMARNDEIFAASSRAYDEPQADAMLPNSPPRSTMDMTEIDL